jgi:adenylosuccinate synthase
VIGNGVVLNPITLAQEIAQLAQAGVPAHQRLWLSAKAHLILPSHRLLDAASEAQKGEAKIGSTLRGISPCYQDKYARVGLRVGDLLRPDFGTRLDALLSRHQHHLDTLSAPGQYDARQGLPEFLEACQQLKRLHITHTEVLLGQALQRGDDVLMEGAQGSLLDVDFGAYPFVTSSHTLAGGATVGAGIAPSHIRSVVGVFKAYCTRVGNGPFPTELLGPEGENLRQLGNEFGSTTGRPRRVGWLDLPALRYAVLLSGVTHLSIMKVDVLAGLPAVQVCTRYRNAQGAEMDFYVGDDELAGYEPVYDSLPGWPPFGPADPLPPALEGFLAHIEAAVGVPVRYVSMGPERDAIRTRS